VLDEARGDVNHHPSSGQEGTQEAMLQGKVIVFIGAQVVLIRKKRQRGILVKRRRQPSIMRIERMKPLWY